MNGGLEPLALLQAYRSGQSLPLLTDLGRPAQFLPPSLPAFDYASQWIAQNRPTAAPVAQGYSLPQPVVPGYSGDTGGVAGDSGATGADAGGAGGGGGGGK